MRGPCKTCGRQPAGIQREEDARRYDRLSFLIDTLKMRCYDIPRDIQAEFDELVTRLAEDDY